MKKNENRRRLIPKTSGEIGFKEFWNREDLVDIALPRNVTSIGLFFFF